MLPDHIDVHQLGAFIIHLVFYIDLVILGLHLVFFRDFLLKK